MPSIPTVRLGQHQITKLIVGGNPFCGNSHFSEKLSSDMNRYFTAEKVVETLHACERAGINTIQARGDYHRILYWLELFRRQGGRMNWIAQTASEMSDIFQNIRIIAAAGAIGIYHHGTQTDKFWHKGQIDRVRDYLTCMRDCGVQVGLGTHLPEVIEYAEDKAWDIDFYMACLYNISRKPRQSNLVSGNFTYEPEEFLDQDRDRMAGVIRATSKTCLAFKVLGAGRNCGSQSKVREAFDYAIRNIKPQDAIVVGMFPRDVDQISLNVSYTMDALAQQTAPMDSHLA